MHVELMNGWSNDLMGTIILGLESRVLDLITNLGTTLELLPLYRAHGYQQKVDSPLMRSVKRWVNTQ